MQGIGGGAVKAPLSPTPYGPPARVVRPRSSSSVSPLAGVGQHQPPILEDEEEMLEPSAEKVPDSDETTDV